MVRDARAVGGTWGRLAGVGTGAATDPVGTDGTSAKHTLWGGSFINEAGMRAASRYGNLATYRDNDDGFRCARTHAASLP